MIDSFINFLIILVITAVFTFIPYFLLSFISETLAIIFSGIVCVSVFVVLFEYFFLSEDSF